MLRQRQKDERRERGEEGEKEEFEAVPSSIADALKDGRLNPTGVFEDQTFADIAALCSFMGKDEQKFYFERQQEKYAARPDGDDKYRLPPTANCFTYAQMTGLWIKPCQFQTVVMDVLEQQPGCSGGWIRRSALHALQVYFIVDAARDHIGNVTIPPDALTALVATVEGRLTTMMLGVSGKGNLQREGSMLGSSMSTSRIFNGTLPGRPSTNSAFSSTRRSAAERSDKDTARLRSGGGGTGGMTPTRSSAMSRAASPPGRAVSLSVTNLDERGGGDDSGGSGSKISAKLISRLREKAGRARMKKGGAMVSGNLLSQLHETVDRAGVKKGGDAMKRLRSLKSLSKMMKAAAIDEYPRADGAEFEEGLLEPELVASAMSHSQEIGGSERESSDGGGGGSGGDGSARTEFDFEERKLLLNAEGIVNHGGPAPELAANNYFDNDDDDRGRGFRRSVTFATARAMPIPKEVERSNGDDEGNEGDRQVQVVGVAEEEDGDEEEAEEEEEALRLRENENETKRGLEFTSSGHVQQTML